MCKKLFLIFLLVFAGQLFPAQAHTISGPVQAFHQAKESSTFVTLADHPNSEFTIVHCGSGTGVRLLPVQKNTFFGTGLSAGIIRPIFLSIALPLAASTSSSKNYIDHIYPYHHFW